ncbi:MAG: hypothetical protein AB1918_15415, partial [Pseudomonadota bacterium]
HGPAAQLVRERLVLKDGRLVGRHNGIPTAEFLIRHGGLDGGDRDLVLEVLTRIAREVHGTAGDARPPISPSPPR